MSRHFLLFFFLLVAAHFSDANAETGTATYYERPYVRSSSEYGHGDCSVASACFSNQDHGVMIAGASNAIWDNRAACGRKYRVQCIGAANTFPHPCKSGSPVTVEIVDYCPPPYCNGTINLSEDAFKQIADLTAGKIRVSFDRVN